MKISRNSPCPCGSGKKYKHCCLKKENIKLNTTKNNSSLNDLLAIIRIGLEKLDAFSESTDKISTKSIGIINNSTMECKFYPVSEHSIDIKKEIATIMAFVFSFINKNSLWVIQVKNIAVRAYSKKEEEIIYALSSFDNAKYIAEGKSIEWLKGTMFQENTQEYRLGIAKKQIAEIESSLRKVIVDVLSKKEGNDWWTILMSNKTGNNIKKTYFNQFSEDISDGEKLINYSFLNDLKKIITTFWKDFKHLFPNKINFEESMIKLNDVRKEEAHNRPISEKHLEELKTVYNFILIKISQVYPDIFPSYLIENWRDKVVEIAKKPLRYGYTDNEIASEKNNFIKIYKSHENILTLIKHIKEIELRLKSLVVPVQKQEIHNQTIGIYSDYRELFEHLIDFVKKKEYDKMEESYKEIENYRLEKIDPFITNFLLSEG